MTIYIKESIVDGIDFYHQGAGFIDNRGLFNLTLSEMQDYIGEPANIFIIRDTMVSNIVYFDDGIRGVYYGSVAGGVHNSLPNLLDYLLNEITPHWYINYVQYYCPNQDKPRKFYPKGRLFNWVGFGKLDKNYPHDNRIYIQD